MTLHLNLPGSHHRSTEQQQELREARRLLRDKIKDDWEYPTLPAWTSSGRADTETQKVQDRIAGFRFHTPSGHEPTNGVVGEALGLGFEPKQWREREYSDISDSAHDEEPSSAQSKESTYRFDAPDSVGAQLSDIRQARKRKRHQALREEMEWNDGLAHWQRRRDVWCCARIATEVRMLEKSAAVTSTTPDNEQHIDSASASASASTSPRTSTSSIAGAEDPSTPGSTPSVSPEASSRPHVSTTSPPLSSPTPLEVLVPIAPPLLPAHPIRRRINATMYPEIYNKIILQSRTPSIPINLRILIDALVQGWKDDGEWPPKVGPLEKSIGRKKGSGAHEGSLKQGVKAVGRVLRLTNTKDEG